MKSATQANLCQDDGKRGQREAADTLAPQATAKDGRTHGPHRSPQAKGRRAADASLRRAGDGHGPFLRVIVETDRSEDVIAMELARTYAP